jgi:hypothetical protein
MLRQNGNFIQQEAYKYMLIKARDDITKSQDMDEVLKGQTIVDKLIQKRGLLQAHQVKLFLVFG